MSNIYHVESVSNLYEAIKFIDLGIGISSINESLQEHVSKTINVPKVGVGTINFLYDGINSTPHPLRIKIVKFEPANGNIEIPVNPNTGIATASADYLPTTKRATVEGMVYAAVGIGLSMFDDIKAYYGYIDKDGRHDGDISREASIRKQLDVIAKKNPKEMKEYINIGKKATVWKK